MAFDPLQFCQTWSLKVILFNIQITSTTMYTSNFFSHIQIEMIPLLIFNSCFSQALFTHPETDIHHHHNRRFVSRLYSLSVFWQRGQEHRDIEFIQVMDIWKFEKQKSSKQHSSAVAFTPLVDFYKSHLIFFRYMDICMGLSLLVSLVSLEYGSMSGERGPLALFLILRFFLC